LVGKMEISVKMSETLRMTWLSILLRVLSVGFLAAFIPWITLILLNEPSRTGR
jgi:hypothetical protein